MAVTLTYEPPVSRVAIAATGLGAATAVRVERSTDQHRWTTVRGATSVVVAGGVISTPLYDYEFTVGTLNYYRVTAVPAGLYIPDSASTPDTAALDIVGDLDILVDLVMNDWTPSTAAILVGKWTAPSDLSYALVIDTAGRPNIWWSTNGLAGTAVGVPATLPLPVANGQRATVRGTLDVNNGVGGKTATFYYSLDAGATFTQLGAPVTSAPPTSVYAGSAALLVGASTWSGVVYSAEVRNGIVGSPVANPQFSTQTNAATSFVDTAGRTWTVGGAAAIRTSQTATITPGDVSECGGSIVVVKSVARPFLNRRVDVVNPGTVKTVSRPSRVGIFDIVGRSFPIAVSDVRKSRRWTMTLRTYTEDESDAVDLLLASGDVLYIQVAPGCPIPGGYVAVGDVEQAAHPLRPHRKTWTLPCVEVAAPGPDVVGSAVTWQTVIDAYASWNDELGDQPSWAEMLTLIGNPTEVIVP